MNPHEPNGMFYRRSVPRIPVLALAYIITTSLSIEMDDFEYAPFYEKGGTMKVYQLFGDPLNGILETLTER